MNELAAALLQDPQMLLIGATALAGLFLLILLMALRAIHRTAATIDPLARNLNDLGQRVAALSDGQQRLTGGLTHVSEAQAMAQTQMLATMERRLEEVTRAMGDSLHGASSRTARSLGELHQRLETIDRAQQNIEKLSGDVLGLQDILANKQTRGAFGEIMLADLVGKALPPDSFRMQATLSNGKRADCLIDLPHPPGPIVIDSKFPLEAYEALHSAGSDAEAAQATRAFRTAVRTHIKAISEKYILAGETADGALMFVPSEAVYAELHANFGEIVREGFTARVWIVSPTTCMATLNTLRAILKDARMKEQAGAIRHELAALIKDLDRLGDRVGNLDRHFGQAQKDIAEIRTSTDRAERCAVRLESFEFDEAPAGIEAPPEVTSARVVRSAGMAAPDAAEAR